MMMGRLKKIEKQKCYDNVSSQWSYLSCSINCHNLALKHLLVRVHFDELSEMKGNQKNKSSLFLPQYAF